MTGKAWRLTDKRLKHIIRQLELQMSVPAIASDLGVCPNTIYSRLDEMGIDHAEVRRNGIAKLRRAALGCIYNIEDPKDMAAAALKYLGKYDVEAVDTSTVTVDVKDAAAEILRELQS